MAASDSGSQATEEGARVHTHAADHADLVSIHRPARLPIRAPYGLDAADDDPRGRTRPNAACTHDLGVRPETQDPDHRPLAADEQRAEVMVIARREGSVPWHSDSRAKVASRDPQQVGKIAEMVDGSALLDCAP